MDVAITGAAGFIGARLSNYLHQRGHRVTAIVRAPEQAQQFEGSGIDAYVCDLGDPGTALDPLFKEVDPVFHLAALFNRPEMTWDDYYRINVDGTKHIMEAAERSGVGRVVHCSTVGVATGNGPPPYSEETPYSPALWDKYETTKCQGERIALDFHQRAGLPVVVIRPAQVYGPGDRSKAKFYRMVKRGIIVNPGNTLKHLIYIDDLCSAFESALHNNNAVGETFIIAEPKPTPLTDLVAITARELKVPPAKIRLPATPITWLCTGTEMVSQKLKVKPVLFRRSMDFFTKSVHFDVTKAQTKLGFRSRIDVPTGVKKTVGWLRENHLL
jgi:nucleoside-diphosphate-sugar epimerase